VKVSVLNPKIWQRLEKSAPVFVFVIALVIRLFFDLVKSDHRLCSFGDAYFFLKTGHEFAKAMTTATGFADFLAKLTVHTPDAGSWATFGSGALGDRLLLDGPVYPFFLAIVHILCGLVGTTDYANNSNTFSVANSITDSLSCVLVFICGRLAFGVRGALVAALLLAVYPPAVINTRLCYADSFTYFILLCWSTTALALFQAKQMGRTAWNVMLSFLLGSFTVLIVLARSFFAPLPIIGLVVLFLIAARDSDGVGFKNRVRLEISEMASRVTRSRSRIAAYVAGFAIVMAPWMWFTHEVTGKIVPWVNRVPGYNLFVGNQLYTDGWRTWPAQPGIPNETGDAIKSLSKNFSSDPIRFVALQLRKESRLWGGVWNDFRHNFFGLGWQPQNVFHNVILMLSFLGLITVLHAPARNRRPVLMFALFAFYHSAYAFFEPVARYVVTAMPFACLLAGQALVAFEKPWRDLKFVSLLAFSILFFALLDSRFSLIPTLFAILPTDMLLPVALLDGTVWLGCWIILGRLAIKVMSTLQLAWWQNSIAWISVSILAVISACNLAFDPARTEWCTELNRVGDGVKVELRLPILKNPLPAVSYVLVDMQTDMPSPAVTLVVNGQRSAPPIPILQLMKDRSDASEVFSLQAQPMTVDPRSYRHWWAFPVLTKSLSQGSSNEISIVTYGASDSALSSVRIFGSYPTSQEELDSIARSEAGVQQTSSMQIPSINKFSWVKGFVTIDRRDPRPYEEMLPQGVVGECKYVIEGAERTDDLSSRFGRQFGTYRVRVFVPPKKSPEINPDDWMSESQMVFEREEETLVAGGDPATMMITKSPVSMPEGSTANSFYALSCEVKKTRQDYMGSIAVNLTCPGQNGEKDISWTSPWSPTSIKIPDDGWQRYAFLDRVPDSMRGKKISASIFIAPFAADRLFLHKKDALRDTVKVRKVQLQYFSQLAGEFSSVQANELF